MGFYVLMSAGLALMWMMIAGQVHPAGFVVGFGFGLLALLLLRPRPPRIHWRRLPLQLVMIPVYVLVLLWDILISSLDVARRALAPEMPLHPGIIAVETQDPQRREIIAALSAHNITVTPGELVVDFEDVDTLYVHVLDLDKSLASAEANQARRLRLLNRIL